jgi:hypothetical protein
MELTKREYFAAKALQGLTANEATALRRNSLWTNLKHFFTGQEKGKTTIGDFDDYARISVGLADSLINELERREKI